ncbi:hypothetical protein HanRHA438_Chr16g0779221 [Helianthus annuus]|nr:hypothetical protein HanRHA438_Chr16g0779221 [Helianthus annuus]
MEFLGFSSGPAHFLFFIHESNFNHLLICETLTVTVEQPMQVPEAILKNMVNSRPKNKKTLKTQASIEDFDHQSTQPGALIGSSDDLLTEILLRLPAASVLRFKNCI